MPLDPSIILRGLPPPTPLQSPQEALQLVEQLRARREAAEARREEVEIRRQAGEERRQKAADEAAKRQRAEQAEQAVQAALTLDPTTGQPTVDWAKLVGGQVPSETIFKLKEEIDQSTTRIATLRTANITAGQKTTELRGALARPVAVGNYAKPLWDTAVLTAHKYGALTEAERDAGLALTDPADIKRATDAAIAAAASEAKPATSGSFEDYVQRVTATSEAPLTPAQLLTMRQDWEAAGRAPKDAAGGTKFQDVDAIVKTPDGKTYTGKVGYNPDANVYAPIGSTEPFPPGTKIERQPTPVDPMVAAIRGLTVQTLREQAATMTPAQATYAKSLADDYTKASEDYVIRAQSHQTLKGAADNPSAAGDIVMIFAFMRQQDPRSTVREGEFATAQNAAGVPEQIRNLYNRVLSGERLSAAQRADFVGQSARIFGAAQQRQRGLYKIYAKRAENMHLNPADVVIDYDQLFGVTEDQTKKPDTKTAAPGGAAPKKNPFVK